MDHSGTIKTQTWTKKQKEAHRGAAQHWQPASTARTHCHGHSPVDFFLKKSGQHRTQMTGLAMPRIRRAGLRAHHCISREREDNYASPAHWCVREHARGVWRGRVAAMYAGARCGREGKKAGETAEGCAGGQRAVRRVEVTHAKGGVATATYTSGIDVRKM